jgi:hypothetical protein
MNYLVREISMGAKYLAVLAAVIGLLSAGIARADECGDYFCQSYLEYDSDTNALAGYSLTWDWNDDGEEMGVVADLYSPDGSDPYFEGSDYEFGEAYAPFGLSEPGAGGWQISGCHSEGTWVEEEDDWVWSYLDTTGDNANVPSGHGPNGEATTYSSGNGYYATYHVVMQPSSTPWTGSVYEGYDYLDDGCYDYTNGNGLTFTPYLGPGTYTYNGIFADNVGSTAPDWVNYYNIRIYLGLLLDGYGRPVSECGWNIHIKDHFNGSVYYSHYSSQWVDGASVNQARDGVSPLAATQWTYPGPSGPQ